MADDTVTYQARGYAPDLVAHRYVRPGRPPWGKGRFLVFECAELPEGHRLRGIGAGPTLREYLTDGEGIPQDVRDDARARKTTVKWP